MRSALAPSDVHRPDSSSVSTRPPAALQTAVPCLACCSTEGDKIGRGRSSKRARVVGGRLAVGLLLLSVITSMALGCGGGKGADSATGQDTTTPEAAGSFEVALLEGNGSGQTGTATMTGTGEGVAAVVSVNGQDVAQDAFVASGTCEALDEPVAAIPPAGATSVTGGATDGRFQADGLVRYSDGTPVTVEDIRDGALAVVVIDDSYRGGGTKEIPPRPTGV